MSIHQISLTLPDGNIRYFPKHITGIEVAKSISPSLAKDSLAIKIDNVLSDLSLSITQDAKIEIITIKSGKIALEIIRHDTAHLLACAVKELFPEVAVTIGPVIEDGFYYDFAKTEPFHLQDLALIENKMHEIAKKKEPTLCKIVSPKQAKEFFTNINEHYKVEIIESIPETETITLYSHGNFTDLCKGPHAPSLGYLKHFKLTKLAGAYWRGDSTKATLQRIYGTAWSSANELTDYLHLLEEAEKRDHRKIGKQLGWFHMQEEATGSVFWHHKGYIIYREIENYIRKKTQQHGYIEVKTPQLIDKNLWEKSGHWSKFKENMFIAESENRLLAVKPMNCPGHVQIFNQELKSYRQLPLRMAEFGCCHRNEPSGSLHGIMRVRSFTQDDAHIFCEEHQINNETIAFCNLLQEVYAAFGFHEILVKFSTRPEVRAGSDLVWDKAESALKNAIEATGLKYELNHGEGAFYGPKLEFTLVDALKRQWQCGTLQVDFVLPERLDVSYIASCGSKKRPVMLHRAILGSLERFIGILIENYAGKLPLWLSPVQVVVTTISNIYDDYAFGIAEHLKQANIRVETDFSSEKITYKIREHSLQKVPFIIIIGAKEQETKTITIRSLGSTEQKNTTINDFIQNITNAIST
jgi:threonyl-tRNA synthetase